MSIKAVIFDLDDTLYPEIEYVKSGCKAISAIIAYGDVAMEKEFNDSFEKIVAQSPFDIIDRFCEVYNDKHFDKSYLLDIYRHHRPEIKLYDDVIPCLEKLKTLGIKLALLTDGRPEGQRNKIDALGISQYFDKIVITDELGGVEFRKPDIRAYEIICKDLQIVLGDVIAVGDNVKKDFGVQHYGAKTVCIERKDKVRNDGSLLSKKTVKIAELYELLALLYK